MEVPQIAKTAQHLQAVRLVASDLDGTLLRPDGTISKQTIALLQDIQQAGITVVLVSAQPPRIVRKIARLVGVAGLAICSNGAIIYDLDQESIIQHTPLLPELATSLVHRLRREIPNLCFACESGLTFQCEPDYYRLCQIQEPFPPSINDALVFCKEPVTKLIALHPTYTAEELSKLTAHFADKEVTITHSSVSFLEISAAGTHKALALAWLCKKLEIVASEVIAFGDMPNDISMLRWAGYSVAVANAHPLVQREADEITLSNGEDGVAFVLKRLLVFGNERSAHPQTG
jgi:Cof subfamily protein (haloacid dehalogenase superfamily)